MAPEAIAALMLSEEAKAVRAAQSRADVIGQAARLVADRLAAGGRLVYVGAGTSGRLALVDAAECGPTFGLADGRILAIVAGGADAHAVAQEAAEDDGLEGAKDIASARVGPSDAVVALSASGSTPYALGAARAASEAGALTVAVVCSRDSKLGLLVDHEVVAVTGPEVIAGSTRMKAGTAQKLVLNTISTVTMVRLGRTFGNLMVDVVASNAKLRARARRVVELATDVSPAEADAALLAADGDAKVAILSLLTGSPVDAARQLLEDTGGSIRRALGAEA
jgi:N-acetylmuramic acid 6-phosphate etherase